MKLKDKLYILVEDHESPQGRVFDYSIQALILLSLLAFALETLPNNSPAMDLFLNRFGRKRRLTVPVTFRPIPFFFFEIPLME